MPKTSKLCQVVYHSTRLDEAKVFILLCAYSGSKVITANETSAPYEKAFEIYSKKLIALDLRFSGVLRIVEEN